MSVNLESVLKNIQSEKNTKLTANNLRYGVNCMGVQGGLHPVTIEGGDIGAAIYLQDTTPEDPNGIWINTDKTYDKIYLENERYTADGSIVFSNFDTTDPSNPIANHTNNGLNLLGATYAQKGNVVHFFGFFSTTSSANTTALVHRHWKYNFDTNTWTQLSNCPTPQGGVKAVWIGDFIYIFGTAYNVNTNYKQYAYKYNTIDDTWERITDLPTVDSYISSHGLACTYDNDDNIYIVGNHYNYKYTVSTGTYTLLSTMGYRIGYGGVSYFNNGVFAPPVSSWNDDDGYIKKYNIPSNTWSNYGKKLCESIFGETVSINHSILINDKIYTFGNNSGGVLAEAMSAGTYPYGWQSLTTSSLYKKISTKHPSSSVTSIIGCPICTFTTETGTIILFFGGITSGTTVNTNNQMGIVVQDKDYTDLKENTLVIYTTDGTMGTYTTPIYQNEKVVNGKIYQRFNDVNLWDAENQTLIKNLHTYYGNGTNWVQIK